MNFFRKNKFKNKQISLKSQSGFTLVEMITAVALFSIVMVVAMGSLLNVLNANKKSQSIQTTVNNISLAMEMITREIRMGYNYHCGGTGDLSAPEDCLTGESLIAFEGYSGNPADPNDQIVFKVENQILKKSNNGGITFLPLTSEEVVIEDFYFVVVGSDHGDFIQPKVLIVAKGYMGDKIQNRTYFNLQTTVSQRILDL